ncbi:uncharacterized protein BX663DRAFT_491093 [Cokeromyces recurvatus]|uniref:uncharacterized protein n=1 Tax=Cokeromyces recurvatus TaxID=90255 RepID=UPI00221F5885|nr:uncharacterized protein BX663DRAFT_491093 [Cokeromyces recurvatus]KAI7907494.1 hypothetical protein BX663DRAFT_491093 [Cokeromyces recurvatus]
MAIGKLIVTPETLRGIPSGFDDASFFVGCYIEENEKHRTRSENGPQPYWNSPLTCHVPEGKNILNLELVNENSNRGGIIATAKVSLKETFEQGKEQRWVQLNSISSGQAFGELKLNLMFSGTNSIGSVTSSFGDMNLGGQQVPYQQKASHHPSSSDDNNSSRQGSFASLGPANPIPHNYGAGSPPPFTPPAAVPYPGNESSHRMPTSPSTPLMNEDGVVNPEKMSKGEFEEAKARGKLPSWAKYGGGALAGLAAVGLTAWGAHELKDHFDSKEDEEKYKKQEKPFVPPSGFLQPESNKQQPYTIHNQQPQQQQQQQQQQQPQKPQPQPQPQKQYPQPPPQQHHFEKKEHNDKKEDHHHEKKEKCDKKEKRDKKEKKHKKHKNDSSSSSSSSSDSSSDSDDDKRKERKEKHHKKKDSEWK